MNNRKEKTLIIAEAGVNHNGSLTLAKQLVDVAKSANACAVKFQTFRADQLVCAHAPKAAYQKSASTIADESHYQMLKSLELSEDAQIELYRYCQKQGILFISSPFDSESVNFLHHKLDLPLIKIASGEITNLPFLLQIARTGKPVILSTGMSTLGEIETALSVLALGYSSQDTDIQPTLERCEQAYFSAQGQLFLQQKISLLHCTTEYPAPFAEVNLRSLSTLAQAFDLPVGYSDHTVGTAVAIAAVACGAEIIEKHFTLDKTLPGPDHQASLEPGELAAMIAGIRQVELALGSSRKIPTVSESKNRLIARKSIVALQKIARGEPYSTHNIGCKRPGSGLSPAHFWNTLNKCAEQDYETDEIIEM